jgi:hypothetical protein
MHVRYVRCKQSKIIYLFNHITVNYCKTYKDLGSSLDEFLNFNITAEAQAEAASRALGALITKTLKMADFPTKYTKCCSIVQYHPFLNLVWKSGGTSLGKPSTKFSLLRAAISFLSLPKNATSVD